MKNGFMTLQVIAVPNFGEVRLYFVSGVEILSSPSEKKKNGELSAYVISAKQDESLGLEKGKSALDLLFEI